MSYLHNSRLFRFIRLQTMNLLTPAPFILAVEKQLGIRLPSSYAEAMQRNNGGEIPTDEDLWELYPLPGAKAQLAGHSAVTDVVEETLERRERPSFPAGAVAIADNGLGDQLVFLPAEEPGQLGEGCWFWHHETGELSIVSEHFGALEHVA